MRQPMAKRVNPDFFGSDYVVELDKQRLTGQLARIFTVMADGKYRTLNEIAKLSGDPPSSVSAQIRHLRKPEFGSYETPKRRRHNRRTGADGEWEYALLGVQAVHEELCKLRSDLSNSGKETQGIEDHEESHRRVEGKQQ